MEFFWDIALLLLVSLLFLGILVLYFLPSLISASRKHKNGHVILILNIFLGWTFIVWVILPRHLRK